jgi:hypothetical protein
MVYWGDALENLHCHCLEKQKILFSDVTSGETISTLKSEGTRPHVPLKICLCSSAVVLEDMVLVSRRLEDLKKGLGLGLDKIVLILAVL